MIRKRLLDAMQQSGTELMLVCSHENVAYCSGVGLPLPFGAVFDYGGGYPLGYVLADCAQKKTTLVISDQYRALAKAESFTDRTIFFTHYDHFAGVDANTALEDALREALASAPKGARIGIEGKALPAMVYTLLKQLGFEIVDGTKTLIRARQIKEPDELERIRRSVYLEDCGQRRLIEYARDFHGETALEMWHGVLLAMDEAAGERVDVWGELATGLPVGSPQTPGGPLPGKVAPGDLGRMDISVRYRGYWCDCTNMVVFGAEPTAHQLECLRVVKEAYDAAFEKLRPGVRMCEADLAAKKVYEKYGREPVVYTGHQIGCGVNEAPRIVCYEDAVFESGMVVCIEPQQYLYPEEGVGARLERVIQITDGAPVELNRFPWGVDL